MLKKSLLSLAITASVAGLSGCNISSVTDNDKATPEAQVAQDAVEAQVDTNIVSPNFSAFTSDFPLGHDFYFADQASTTLATTLKDGTAHSGAEGSNSENAVTNAIDDLDGGISTLAPLDITMSGTIDSDTVIAGSTVRLIRLPNASNVSSGELILPGTLTAADVDALSLGTLAPFFATTKADGTAADDSAFAAAAAIGFTQGIVLPESVAALNLYGMNDGIPGNGDGILAMQPAASNDGDDTNDDYEVSVISIDGGTDNVIRISPKTPLAAKSKYIVVLTGGIMTPEKVVNGETIAAMAIQPSTNYTYITGTEPAFSGAVTGLRASVDGWELMAGGILGAAALADGIALTMAYTTVDPETVLKSMAYPGYFNPLFAGITTPMLDLDGDGTPETTPYEHPRSRSTALITNAGGVGVNQIPAASLNASLSPKVLVSQAGIELPQYTAALATSPTGQWEHNDLVATVAAGATGSAIPTDINGDKNVTYRFPFAQEQRKTVVPMLLVEPTTTAKATAIAALDGIEGTTAAVYDSGCVKPANGWETIIVQHGITVDRAAALATASTLVASTCHAVVAMDLPHHGIAPVSSDRNGVAIDNSRLGIAIDNTNANPALTPFAYAVDNIVAADATSLLANLAERHEGLTANALLQPVPMTYGAVGDADSPASGTSGDFFIRLDVFQRTRDNMRQAVMDLLNLNATIASIDVDGDTVADLDASNVHFVGHSLGAIVGTTFVAVNNDTAVLAGNTNLNQIKTAVLATPGGALPKLLESSVSFSASLLPSLAAAGLTQGSSSLEAFYATFQATIDTADPANFIQSLAAGNGSATPSMMIEMVGGTAFGADIATTDTSLSDDLLDVGAYLADLVVPNNAIGSVMADGSARPETAENTMAGTDKLIELLGSTNVNTAGANAQAYPVTKYATGTHGTFSSAAPVDAFTEMMVESATFIMSEGTAVSVANPAVLQP